MLTILIAVFGIFLLMTMWVGIDQLARKQLGERARGCHSWDPNSERQCHCAFTQDDGAATEKPEECPHPGAICPHQTLE